MRRALPILLGLVLVALVAVGLSQAGGGTAKAPERAPYDLEAGRRELAGSPPALARLHAQAAEVLGGGEAAFAKRLRALRGRPIVVNVWASWCAPCKFEFPVLQRVATARGKEVAFLGVIARDGRVPAERYLQREPLPYPSYLDPKGDPIVRSLKLPKPVPITVFVRADGEIETSHAGAYTTAAELEADIDRYLRP